MLDRDERISRYLKGLMSIQEETKFLADMESDEQLKQDAITQARLVKGMAQVDYELIQELKNTPEASIRFSPRPYDVPAASLPPRSIFRNPITWLYAAASVVVLIFAGYKGYDYYDTTRLGMKYATAFPMETLVRGDIDSNVDKELQTLFENVIKRKDLTATTKRLSELWERSNQETYNDYTDYAAYIGWYLAIGYLEDYEKDKALCVLHTMLEDDNVSLSIKDQINELLKRL